MGSDNGALQYELVNGSHVEANQDMALETVVFQYRYGGDIIGDVVVIGMGIKGAMSNGRPRCTVALEYIKVHCAPGGDNEMVGRYG